MTVKRRPTRRCPAVVMAGVLAITLVIPLTACGSSGGTRPTGDWTLASYTNRAGTVAAPPTAATISFAADGKVTGTTGCNTFGGRWSTDSTTLRFASVGMTAKASPMPP